LPLEGSRGDMARRHRLGFLLVVIIFGVFIGGVVGEIIDLLMPEGVVKQFFVSKVSPGFEPHLLDLGAFEITLGFRVHVNVISVLGVCLAAYLFRYYR
jgi:hypothetical protein